MQPQRENTPTPDESSTYQKPPGQLALRLFATVGNFRRAPPERALFRELLALAIGEATTFRVGEKTISAAVVHHVGCTLYFRANAAGIIEDFSVRTLAADAHLSERPFRLALHLFQQWHVLQGKRDHGRRRPATHRFNVGGLDWPAVRKRAAVARAEFAQQRLDLRESGPGDRTESECGPGDRTESGPGDRTKGLQTEGLKEITAAVDPYRARRTTVQRQQQQPEPPSPKRINGLLAAIAVRSRDLGRAFDEAALRRQLVEGEIDVDGLQRRADELATEGKERQRQAARLAADSEAAAREAARQRQAARLAADSEAADAAARPEKIEQLTMFLTGPRALRLPKASVQRFRDELDRLQAEEDGEK